MTTEQRFQAAERGRRFWLDFRLDQYDCVLLLAGDDADFNAELLRCLQTKLQRENKRGGVISVDEVSEMDNFALLRVSAQTALDIIQLYCMYEFTDLLIIGSVNAPYGNRLANLLAYNPSARIEIIEQVLFQV